MEPQAFNALTEAYEKVARVRDNPSIGDKEQAIIIDVAATLRTVLAMYTSPEQEPPPQGFTFRDITRKITGD